MSVGQKPTDEGDNVYRSLQRSSEVLTSHIIIVVEAFGDHYFDLLVAEPPKLGDGVGVLGHIPLVNGICLLRKILFRRWQNIQPGYVNIVTVSSSFVPRAAARANGSSGA